MQYFHTCGFGLYFPAPVLSCSHPFISFNICIFSNYQIPTLVYFEESEINLSLQILNACLYCSQILSFRNYSFAVGNGGLKGGFYGDRNWEFGGVAAEILELTEGAVPQPDRPAPENRRHPMQTHRCQSSLSRNGAFSKLLYYYY